MAIYRNANGQYGVDWRDEFGRRHRRQVGSREAALAVEAKLREQAKTRPAISPAALTIEEAAALYLQQIHAAARTRQTYAHAYGKISAQLAHQRLDKLTPRDLTDWYTRNLEQYGPNTTYLRVGMLKRLFRWLEAAQLSPDIAKHLNPPRRETGRFHILTYDEEARLLDAAAPRIRLRLLLCLDAGLAIQDATHARRSHWNAERGLILYRRHKTNANATIPTTRRLQAALAPLRDMPAGAFLTANHALRRQSDALSNLREKTGIQFTTHDLRRTFATRLAAVETNPIVIAAMLGHTTPYAVQLAYVHPTEDMLRAAIRRMEEANPNCAAAAIAEDPPAETPPAQGKPRLGPVDRHKIIDTILHIG